MLWWSFFLNQTETPEVAYQAAERLLEEGEYARASNASQVLTLRFLRYLDAFQGSGQC